MADYSASPRGFTSVLGIKHYGDSSYTTQTALINGTLTQRLNASAELSVTVQSPRGIRNLSIIGGDRVRLNIVENYGATGNIIFEGLVPMDTPMQVGQTLSFKAYDYISQANQSPVYISPDTTNYDGWDASKAFENIAQGLSVDGGTTQLFTNIQIEQSGVNILPTHDISSDHKPRKATWDKLVNIIRENASDPLTPKQLYYYQFYHQTNGVTLRGFIRNDSNTSLMTLGQEDILDSDKEISGEWFNSASIDGTDILYAPADLIKRKGYKHKNLAPISDDYDVNYQYDKDFVNTYKKTFYSYKVNTRKLLYVNLGNYITLERLTTGANGKFMMTEKVLEFGVPAPALWTTCSALTPIIL